MAVRRGAATLSRKEIEATLLKRQEKDMWNRQTGYFRSRRLWQDGSMRTSSEIITTNYLMAPNLTKSEVLRAESVRESLLNFTSLEMIYFGQCLRKSIEYCRQMEDLEQERKAWFDEMLSGIIRYLSAVREPGRADGGDTE